MGLLDDLLRQCASPGSAASPASQPGGAGSLLTTLNQALASHGGVPGLVAAFQQGGLGHVIASWISTGPNVAISPDQLTRVLGSDRLRDLATRLGVSPDAAAGTLAAALPKLVDCATPDGKLPDLGGLEAALGSLLKT